MLKNVDELQPIIEKRNGIWGFRIELGFDEKGKRRVKTSFRKKYTRKTALIAANEWIKEYAKKGQILLKNYNLTIKEISDISYAKYYELNKNKLKRRSILQRKGSYERINNMFGDILIKDFKADMYQKHVDDMYAKGSSKSYLDDEKTTLSLIFKTAIRLKLVDYNLAKNIDTTKPFLTKEDALKYSKERELIYFEYTELIDFLEKALEILDYRFYVAFRLLGNSGMRPGELQALEWADLDTNERYLNIYKTLYRENDRTDGWIVTAPKNKHSIRKTYITQGDVDCLLKLKELQEIEWEARNKNLRSLKSDFIFTHTVYPGYPVGRSSLDYALKKVLKELPEIDKKISLHKFRHTHISVLAEAGATLAQIFSRVGHADADVTEKIYLHHTVAQRKKAIQIYENYITKGE